MLRFTYLCMRIIVNGGGLIDRHRLQHMAISQVRVLAGQKRMPSRCLVFGNQTFCSHPIPSNCHTGGAGHAKGQDEEVWHQGNAYEGIWREEGQGEGVRLKGGVICETLPPYLFSITTYLNAEFFLFCKYSFLWWSIFCFF